MYVYILYILTTVEASTVSISPLTYEILESEGTVNVVVTKTGDFMRQIRGTLTTSTASAGGKINDFSISAHSFNQQTVCICHCLVIAFLEVSHWQDVAITIPTPTTYRDRFCTNGQHCLGCQNWVAVITVVSASFSKFFVLYSIGLQ